MLNCPQFYVLSSLVPADIEYWLWYGASAYLISPALFCPRSSIVRLARFVLVLPGKSVMKFMLTAALCAAAIIGQISTASAQYYYYGSPAGIYQGSPQPQGPPGPYYYYGSAAGIYQGSPQPQGPPGPYYYNGSPAGIYYAQPQQAPGLARPSSGSP